jgi:hypothetical protein
LEDRSDYDGFGTNGSHLTSHGAELPIDGIDEALFTAATRVTVHNGKKTSFWKSSWLHGCAPVLMFPTLYNRSKRKNRSVASAMTSENWIRDLMHELNPTLLIEYIRLWMLRNHPTMPTILEMMTSFG